MNNDNDFDLMLDYMVEIQWKRRKEKNLDQNTLILTITHNASENGINKSGRDRKKFNLFLYIKSKANIQQNKLEMLKGSIN